MKRKIQTVVFAIISAVLILPNSTVVMAEMVDGEGASATELALLEKVVETEVLEEAQPIVGEKETAQVQDLSVADLHTLPVTPDPTPAIVAHEILITKVANSGSFEYVELYNPNEFAVSLAGWQLQYLTKDFTDGTTATKPTRALKQFNEEIIEPQGFYVVAHTGAEASGLTPDAWFDSNYSGGSLAKEGAVRLIVGDKIIDLVGWAGAKQFETQAAVYDEVNPLQRCQLTSGEVIDSNNNRVDFKIYDVADPKTLVACSTTDPADDDQSVEPPDELPVEENLCQGLKLSEVAANVATDNQFIEIYNPTKQVIDLKGCRLQTNRSETKFFEFGNLELATGQYLAVKIIDTELTLTKTTSGKVFLQNSLMKEVDAVEYSNLNQNTALALVEGSWVVTYAPTFDEANVYQRFLPCAVGYERNELTGRCNKIFVDVLPTPCKPGQYRHPETGRCRNIEVEKPLAPCKEGQYRSEETGRCRSIALAARTLKACADDEFRNPLTNRCKKIASKEDTLQPCHEGYERNPATNRCRKIITASMPAVPFAPEQVQQVAQSSVGWWVLGGVSLVAVAYAGWQWRFEVSQLIRRLAQATIGKGK